MTTFEVHPIGTITQEEQGTMIKLNPEYIPGLRALEGFSHIQAVWWFSDCDIPEARAILENPQPYKNAPEIMGTFATRSPARPKPLALTTVEVLHIDHDNGTIQIPYIDANDGTPLLDIKPYTPSMDRIESPEVPDWCSHWPKSYETSGDFEWEKEFNF